MPRVQKLTTASGIGPGLIRYLIVKEALQTFECVASYAEVAALQVHVRTLRAGTLQLPAPLPSAPDVRNRGVKALLGTRETTNQ